MRKALSKLTIGQGQATLAGKLFGRGAKEVLAVLKETGGNLDETIKKYKDLGVLITTDVARAGDAAADKFRLVEVQFERVKQQIGQQLTPVFLKFAEDFSKFLRENPEQVRAWGDTLVTVVKATIKVLEFLSGATQSINIAVAKKVAELNGQASPDPYGPGGSARSGNPYQDYDPKTKTFRTDKGGGSENGDIDISRLGGTTAKQETADDRGRQRLKELREQFRQLGRLRDEYTNAIKTATNVTEENTAATEVNRLKLELVGKSYEGLSESVRIALLAKAKEIDDTKVLIELDKRLIAARIELTKQLVAFGEESAHQLDVALSGADTALTKLFKIIEYVKKEDLSRLFKNWHFQFAAINALLLSMRQNIEALDLSKIKLPDEPDTGRDTPDPFANLFNDTPPDTEAIAAQRDFLAELKAAARDSSINNFVNALNDLATGAENAGEAFREMALSIIADIQAMVIEFLVLEAVKGILGLFTGGTSGIAFAGLGGGLGGIPGAAEGGEMTARPGGRLVMVAEAGHDEVILTTDPKHRNRTEGLLSAFLARTGIVPRYGAGGFAQSVVRSTEPSIPRLAMGGVVEAPTVAQLTGGGLSIGRQTNQLILPNVKDASSFRNSRQQIERDAGRVMLKGARRLKGGQG